MTSWDPMGPSFEICAYVCICAQANQSMQSRQTRSGLSKDTNRKVSMMLGDYQTFAARTARAWHVVSQAKASCDFLSGISTKL